MSTYRQSGGGSLQRSGGERSEPELRCAPSNGADFTPPDPEVSGKPVRRRFSAKYKLKIVTEAERCDRPGQIGALLRREGLYSSQLAAWRKLRDQGALHGLSEKKRGPKDTAPSQLKQEAEKLRRENARLQKKLAKAEAIIAFQKKVHALLGSPLEEMDPGESE